MGIYKGHGIYKKQGIYNGAGIYKGDGIYKDGFEHLLNVPAMTLRFLFNAGVDPTTLGVEKGSFEQKTELSSKGNIWDWTYNNNDWSFAFRDKIKTSDNVVANVIASGDLSGVTITYGLFWYCSGLYSAVFKNTKNLVNMQTMFGDCSNLKRIPYFNVKKVINCSYAFSGCREAETGLLRMYNALSSTGIVETHTSTFYNCGIDTATGLAELQQIPASWGGRAGALAMMSEPQGDNETDPETGLAELQQNQIDDTPDGANN